MFGLKLDAKKIAVGVAGKGVGLAVAHKVNNIPFVQKQKWYLRALGLLVIGEVVLPKVGEMLMGKGKKGAGDFVAGASQAMGTYATGIAMGNIEATKSFVPAITGYEDNVYLGAVIDDSGDQPAEMGGYEDNPVSGADDVYGEGY